jgi:hypothetical protein
MKKQHKLVILITILLSTILSHAMDLNLDPQAPAPQTKAFVLNIEKAADRYRADSSSSSDSDYPESEITA